MKTLSYDNQVRLAALGMFVGIIAFAGGAITGFIPGLWQWARYGGFGGGAMLMIAATAWLTKIEARRPSRPPIDVLPPEATRAPSFDAVTLPGAIESLWYVTLTMFSVVGSIMAGASWYFIKPESNYVPGACIACILLYLASTQTKPGRRIWTGRLGEWRAQPWSEQLYEATVYSLIELSHTSDRPSHHRLHRFSNPVSLYAPYWAEVGVKKSDETIVSYLRIRRVRWRHYQIKPPQTLQVQIRESKLHPKRLQLRLVTQ